MSWNRNSRKVLTAAAALLMGGTAIAAPLVVRASGPAARAYPPGRALAADARLTLGPTDQVTILDAKGTRTFKGPGTFAVAGASTAAGTSTTLAALVSQPGERRARIGAVRSVGGAAAPRSPNIWYVEADRSGAHCVNGADKVTLWRPDMTAAQRYTITGGGRTEIVDWMKGQSARDWPAALPVRPGVEYTIAAEGQAAPAKVSFVTVAAADAALDTLATKLIAAKCTAQLDLLVDTASAAEPAQPTG